jgi:hypothetical protein
MRAGRQVLKMMRLAAALALCAAGAGQAAAKDKTPAEWQAIARADLDAVRDTVKAAHPGWIDEQNPAFRAWTEQGYLEAEALVPRVVSYDSMMSAVRYYVTGFRDGHFVYSDNVRSKDYRVLTNGWMLDRAGEAYVVAGRNPEWQGELPPLGAKLLSCDGRTVDSLVAEYVAPYVDRRAGTELRKDLAGGLGVLHLAGQELKRCLFEQADGKRLDFAVSYQALPSESIFRMLRMQPAQPRNDRSNAYSFGNGVLWIRARNFNMNSEQVQKLDAMLKEVAALQGVRRIVFDTRGNGGGDGRVGEQILWAATGGLEFDRGGLEHLPRFYPQWRVSDVSIYNLGRAVEKMGERYGSGSVQVKQMEALRERLKQAKQAGQPWLEQEGGPRLTRADIERRGGKLRRFAGTVALVTDKHCASACLDFADAIRQIPGSVHLGQTTGSDTLYLERGLTRLPSGNLLFLPMKVWRNRVRGDGEALVPDVPLQVDMNDDAAVRTATMAALEKLPNPAGASATAGTSR